MHDGLVVVDKPAGWTSHDVVARLRRAYGQRRVGHAGTLDPDATGVLLVGFGRATRLLRFLQETTKAYRGRIVFGIATTTLDASGAVLDQRPMMLTRDEIERGTAQFLGDIEQLPPMVSAVQVGGRRLHELAVEGKEVERAPRHVRVDRFDIEEFEPGAYPGRHRAGRVQQRHLHPVARRRSRCRARRVRAPRVAAPAAGRLVRARRGARARRRARRPRAQGAVARGRRCATSIPSSSTRSRRVRWRTACRSTAPPSPSGPGHRPRSWARARSR